MKMDFISYNGKNSYADFGLIMTDKNMGGLERKRIIETIPYCNFPLTFDFSDIMGAIYKERKITYTFVISSQSENDLFRKYAEICNWLMPSNIGQLSDSDMGEFYYIARCLQISALKRISARTGSVSVDFAANPYMSNGGANIDILTTENILGTKEYMLYRVSEAVECAYITNGDIVSAPPVYAVTVSGYSGNISVSVSSNQKIHYRIQGTDKLAHVQISYTGSGGSTSTIITADYIDTKANTYDFYICNRNGTLNFNFTFKQSLTAAADGVASIVGRKVNTVAISGFNDPLLPITVKTEGKNGCTVQCNDDYSQTFQPSTTAKAAFEIGYGYNRINFAGGGAVTATLKYLTLIEVL